MENQPLAVESTPKKVLTTSIIPVFYESYLENELDFEITIFIKNDANILPHNNDLIAIIMHYDDLDAKWIVIDPRS